MSLLEETIYARLNFDLLVSFDCAEIFAIGFDRVDCCRLCLYVGRRRYGLNANDYGLHYDDNECYGY